MKEREFNTQVFRTAAQWGSGLFYRLKEREEGGLTILSLPTVAERLDSVRGITSPMALAADCCGILYVLDRDSGKTYKYDSASGVSERVFCPETLAQPGRILLSGMTLWACDKERGRVISCSLKNSQITSAIDIIEEPLDIAVNSDGDLYVLDGKTKLISRFDRHGSCICSFVEHWLREPVSIAVGREGLVYVADKQGFMRFSKEGEYLGAGTGFGCTGTPKIVVADTQGGGFTLNDAGEVYLFDDEGGSVGRVRFPEDAGRVVWITADGCGKLYASTETGIYVLVQGKAFTREKGFYYSKTLDSGIAGNRWHRMVMQGDIPPDTAVDIYSFASDQEDLRESVDNVLADPAKTAEEKATLLDSLIPWGEAEVNAKDMLFRGKEGRFLWLKIGLMTYNDAAAPVVREMQIFSPRISYLRYLPAIYQEDPLSRDFLERFLSLFESVFYDLEADISDVTRYLDPDTTPPEFLRWLASWVNMAIEEDWGTETKRAFIRQAARLYTMKGTAEGISRFINIYTGKSPVILEPALSGSPVVLGGEFRLGVNAMLVKAPIRGFRLGDSSVIGRVAIRNIVSTPEEPFLTSAYSFSVVIDLTKDERERYEKGLRRIIADGKPAHTSFTLRIAGELSAGAGGYVGISTRVGGFDPLRIGSSTIGAGLLLYEGEVGGQVGDRGSIGKDTRLS